MENLESYQDLTNELDTTKARLKEIDTELQELRLQLEEANDIIHAIRSGEVDAIVVKEGGGHQLYTLKSADQTYRIFIEQMTEGAITLNADGRILYSNSQFAAMVGAPLETVTGKSIYQFINLVDREHCEKLISRAWKNNTKGELSLMSQQNREVPVLMSLKTLDLDEGVSLSIILTDLTEQKAAQRLLQLKNMQLEEAQLAARNLNMNLENTVQSRTKDLELSILEKIGVEKQLRSNEERLSMILETMAEGVAIVDKKGEMSYANPMARKLLGLKQSEAPGQLYDNPRWKILKVDGTLLPENEQPITVSMSSGQPVYDYEIAIQPPDRERFYISINAAPIRNEQGEVIAGIGTFMDVTNRRKIIQQKDEFISVASHELRTPITSLKASLQLLNRMKDSPSAPMLPKLIDQANTSLSKVSRLIADLLNATRITEGQLELDKTEFILADIIEDCCSHIFSNSDCNVLVQGDTNIKVHADARRVEQVILNLLNNAVKYAPGSDIILEVEKGEDNVKVSVTDHGPGIPSEKLEHLFDRYYKVDNSATQYSGLGLGLYISSEIIKKHNGQIGVESSQGNGSTFWFTLPL